MARVLYGRRPVEEAVRRDVKAVACLHVKRDLLEQLRDLVRLAEASGIPVRVVSPRELDRLASGGHHQGIAATMVPFRYAERDEMLELARRRKEEPLLLVLDQIQDPQNLGAMVRSAAALGAHGVILPRDRAVGVTAAVERAASGATLHVPIGQVTNLRQELIALKEAGVWAIGLVPTADRTLATIDLRRPVALVVGSEGRGIRPLVERECDDLGKIPMAEANVASLNASAAAAVSLYEVIRQRRSSVS